MLGRDDIGHLAPGMSAEFIAIDAERKPWIGAHADPVAAIVLCQTDAVDYSFVNGRKLIDDGRLTTVDYDVLAEKTRTAAMRLSS